MPEPVRAVAYYRKSNEDDGSSAALRDVLREMVSRVELHFEHIVSHGKERSRFVRGEAHLRGEAADYNHTHCSR